MRNHFILIWSKLPGILGKSENGVPLCKKKIKNKSKGPRNHDYCRCGIRNKCAWVQRFVFTCSMKY